MQRCESGKHLGLLWRSGLFISLHLFPLSQIVVCSLCWQKVGHYMLSCFPMSHVDRQRQTRRDEKQTLAQKPQENRTPLTRKDL